MQVISGTNSTLPINIGLKGRRKIDHIVFTGGTVAPIKADKAKIFGQG